MVKTLKGHVCRLILLAVLPAASTALHAQEYIQLPGVIHVHSTFSSGHYSLAELVDHARSKGLQVLVVTDHDLVAMEYGLFPLRNLLRKREERPSILSAGPEKYLTEIRRLNQVQNDVIIIPGAQSSPFYHWAGSVLNKELTAHDYRKEILLVGLNEPDDYRKLPVMHGGFSTRYFWVLLPRSLILLICLILGGVLLFQGGRWRIIGLGVTGFSLLLLINHHPFQSSLYDPYHGEQGIAPYQELIDYVGQRGGLTFWAHPESKYAVQGTQHGIVKLQTSPYPESLLESKNYTGFAALYGDTATATEPGEHWDRVLLDYCRGERETPVWGIAGADFHVEKNDVEIDSFQTVFLVERKDRESILRALVQGHFYAVRKPKGARLTLEEFVVRDANGGLRAVMGEDLAASTAPIVCGQVSASDGGRYGVEVRLIRGGRPWHEFKGVTPLAFQFIDTDAFAPRTFYRLEVRGRQIGRLISNPIFVSRIKQHS